MLEIHSLGVILKEIGNFSMKGFGDRLTLQKTIYLLQTFGVNLGYSFSWYLHGTYCPTLTRHGFELEHIIKEIPDIKVKFLDTQTQSRYEAFLQFMNDKKMNPDALEIASSICYFNKRGFSKENTLQLVENKKTRFTADECVQIWNELEGHSVIRI